MTLETRLIVFCRFLACCGRTACIAGALLVVAQVSIARQPLPAITPVLSAGVTTTGVPFSYPQGAAAKVTSVIVTLAPGQETGWHTHAVPVFGYVLEGELTVDYGPHGKRFLKAGESVMEAIATPHNGFNSGSGPMRILAVFIGADGVSNSSPAEPVK